MDELNSFPAPFGLTVRYAVKANTNRAIIKLMEKQRGYFDASSMNEVIRLERGAKVSPRKIRLTSQEVPTAQFLEKYIPQGLRFTACSPRQLEIFGKSFPEKSTGIRWNIGIGSGWTAATSTGGPATSFGIPWEDKTSVDALLEEFSLTQDTVHIHIGSGSDSKKQRKAAIKALEIVKQYPSVNTLNIGGGFKVERMDSEQTTVLREVGTPVEEALYKFSAENHDRHIHLEIEPGTYAIANAGYILGKVIDVKSTKSMSKEGFDFIIADTGMTDNTRVSLYGAQHPIMIIPSGYEWTSANQVVSGRCCESGDVLTVAPGEPEVLQPRSMLKARPGDLIVIGGSGAYCASMSTANYNSHLASPEVLVRKDEKIALIREKQPLEDLWKYEKIPDDLR